MAQNDPLNRYRKQKEEVTQHIQTYEEILKGLREDPRFEEEFAAYDPDSVEAFFRDYAYSKANLLKNGPALVASLERTELEWVEAAFEGLEQIQQKKLFDLQCLWRAEKITLPGIEISYDFRVWEENILNCPYLEPITEEEVDLYSRYLESFNYEPNGFFGYTPWQDYEILKLAYDNNGFAFINFPEWYDFHNAYTGGGMNLTLPNVRGQKEQFYIRILTNQRIKETVSVQQMKALPLINIYKEGLLDWFVKTFEDEETQAVKALYPAADNPEGARYDAATEYTDFLSRHGDIWPIKASPDWLEALEMCKKSYTVKKTADALPAAFEEYKMRISLGLPFEEKEVNLQVSFRETCRKEILAGRVLAGEPENFDF